MDYRNYNDHERAGDGYANTFDKKNEETYAYNNDLLRGARTDGTPYHIPTADEKDYLRAKETMVQSVLDNCIYNLHMDRDAALRVAHLAAELCYDKKVPYEDAVKEAVSYAKAYQAEAENEFHR